MATITLCNVQEAATLDIVLAVQRRVEEAGASCVVSGTTGRLRVQIAAEGGMAPVIADSVAAWYESWGRQWGRGWSRQWRPAA